MFIIIHLEVKEQYGYKMQLNFVAVYANGNFNDESHFLKRSSNRKTNNLFTFCT